MPTTGKEVPITFSEQRPSYSWMRLFRAVCERLFQPLDRNSKVGTGDAHLPKKVGTASGSPARAAMVSTTAEEGDAPASLQEDGHVRAATTGAGTIPLYNFEHGFSSQQTVCFGPYVIRAERSEHLDRETFSSSGGRQYSPTIDGNDQLANEITTLPSCVGQWAETAVVEVHPALDAKSVLFPAFTFLTGRDDLAFLLWFLTGREVAVGEDRPQRFMLGGSADRLVGANYFYFPVIDWSKVTHLASTGANDALYAACLALASPDLILKISVVTGALDSMVNRWFADTQPNPYTKAIRAHFKDALGVYETKLAELGVPPTLVADVVARIPARVSASALMKLQAFLIAHGMLDANAAPEVMERVRMLNTHRNTIAHSARIHVDPSKPLDRELLIAGAVSFVLTKICRVYIAKHLLGVVGDDYGVERDEKWVRDFFETGRFHGQDVFNESYDDFVRRVNDAWTQRGEFPV